MLLLWWALLGAPRHRTQHSQTVLGTGTGQCEQHSTHSSSPVSLYYMGTVRAANPVALLIAPHCWQKCSRGCCLASFLYYLSQHPGAPLVPGVGVLQLAQGGPAGWKGWPWVRC